MILKNIVTRTTALKSGLLFWTTIELEDKGKIHRCVVDLAKGLEAEAVAGLVENLAQQIREV